MGQSYSYPDENRCSSMTNDEIAYRTKQYLTLNKIIDILLDVENKQIDFIQPEMYLIDISDILFDLYLNVGNTFTLDIFKPENKIIGVHNGVIQTDYYTIFHEYNDFILKEYNILHKDDTRILRAKSIREKAIPISKLLLERISSFCSDIGKASFISVNGVVSPIEQNSSNIDSPSIENSGSLEDILLK